MQKKTDVVTSVGRALFLMGMVFFLIAPFRGSFTVTTEMIEGLRSGTGINEKHRDALLFELDSLKDEPLPVAALLRGVNDSIDRANQKLASSDKIWDYDRGQYRQLIAGEALNFHSSFLSYFLMTFVLASLGAFVSFVPRLMQRPGINNNGVMHSNTRSRGAIGIAAGVFLIMFYILLYFFPEYIVSWIRLGDPLSFFLRSKPSSQWFFYGLLYTFAVIVMGVRMLIHYRHSRYQLVRTVSVMFFQLGFAFLIPAILASLNRPEVDFKNIWPLDYSFFYAWRLDGFFSGGAFGWFVLFWGIGLILFGIPLLTYFFGKRWYCSWVCGCGGLAETLGDPFRHLSSKKLKAWKIERWSINTVLVMAVGLTAIVLINYISARGGDPLLGDLTWRVQKWYGFLISSIFAGVVGTGFYPLLGNRIWCRFGCPLAAILGIVQKKKSRFRITVNGGQCISCGNCSTYCEMGIDVRSYAQRGQNIIRSSCVGCGVCSSVCPRGVLTLETGPEQGRFNLTSLVQINNGPIDIQQ